MFKSSVAFLFAASLLCAAQNSQPSQQAQPQSPQSQPAVQVPEQQPQPQTAPAATTPEQQKLEPGQDLPPWRKIKVVPPAKPERIPTGTLDKATPA